MKPMDVLQSHSAFSSRRNFLKAAAFAGSMLALTGCKSPPAVSTGGSPETTTTPPTADAFTASATPKPEYLPAIGRSNTILPLPAPRMNGGLPLMQALQLRASRRSYREEEIPLQVLSDLLWAAFGVNRPDSGLRTAPSAINLQDIDIYLATAKGVFRFDAGPHALQTILPDDVRAFTGTQSFVAQAPVNLVYVSNYEKFSGVSEGDLGGDLKVAWSWAHTGLIAQNVYLFCASEGLATVVRSMVDRNLLSEKMKLDDTQKIVLAQTVGYPT
jgi:SagB-type dehydrogenase family enzyme